MPGAAEAAGAGEPHVPVLLEPLLEAVAPVEGTWIDGTFGAGGYTRGLLEAGADRVIGIDRDPDVLRLAEVRMADCADRIELHLTTFSHLDETTDKPVDGVVLDLGVSSMQLDQPERGFSFASDGPLDMRMAQEGPSAADLVNTLPEATLADIIYQYGEERQSRRIAKEIVKARTAAPIRTTAELAAIVERCLPRRKPGQSHPATRTFQALRIAVNDELGELVRGLEAAERAIRPGGRLAVVSFHSLEDRVVKRFFQQGSGAGGWGNRYAPEPTPIPARWTAKNRGITADAEEVARNPRARSATLRHGARTDAPARPADRAALGLPALAIKGDIL